MPEAILIYPPALIASVLRSVKTIALVGASANPQRPSHEVMKFLQGRGFRVIPVNPGLAGQVLLGETVYESLAAIDEPIDMVEIFRRSEAVPPIVDAAIKAFSSEVDAGSREENANKQKARAPKGSSARAKVVWMQLGVRDDAAAAKAEAAGLTVIMDRCPKIEIELGRL